MGKYLDISMEKLEEAMTEAEDVSPKKKRKTRKRKPKSSVLICSNPVCKIEITWNYNLPRPTRCGRCGSLLREI